MKKFRIFAGIIVFVLVGLLIYTFANPADDNTKDKNNTDDKIPTIVEPDGKDLPTPTIIPDTTIPTATVTFSTTAWTNQDVVVTLSFNETVRALDGWTKIDNRNYQKAYAINGSNDILFQDLAGNGNSVNFNITNIDKVAPTVVVTGNPDTWTNNDVKLMVAAQDAQSGLSTNAYSYDEAKTWIADAFVTVLTNKTVTIKVTDVAGNINTQVINVTKIDKDGPTFKVTGNPTDWTNQNVTLTIENASDNNGIGLALKPYSFDLGNTWTTDFDSLYKTNQTVEVWVSDALGNISKQVVNITKIDKVLPTFTMEANPTWWSNDPITVTITAADDASGVKEYSFDGGTNWQTSNVSGAYTSYQILTVKVKDNAGNIRTKSFEVKYDNQAPTVKISADITDWTNTDVVLTVDATDNGMAGLAANPYSFNDGTRTNVNTITISSNQTIKVEVWDKAGNKKTKYYTVSNIDKVKPTINAVTGNPTAWTNQDATLVVDATDDLSGVAAYRYDTDPAMTTNTTSGWIANNSYLFSENGYYTIWVKDNAGNKTSYDVQITKIDKVDPVVGVTYSTSLPTNGNVLVTIKADEPIEPIFGWTYVTNKKYTKLYTTNTTENVTVIDRATNDVVVTISVTNIDKTLPTATLGYSETIPTNDNVTVTLTASETIVPIAGWTKVSDTVYTKVYMANTTENVIFNDLAGNSNFVQVSISNVDKKAPSYTSIAYSVTDPTNGSVTATLIVDEAITSINTGWTKVSDTKYTKTYTDNANETITFADAAGNTGTVNVVITNIDKMNPKVTQIITPLGITNQSVLVRLLFDEPVKAISGWTFVNNKEYTKLFVVNGTEPVNFTDLAGNADSTVVTVSNIDKVPPVITLKVPSVVNFEIGNPAPTSFASYVTATDDKDGDITSLITLVNPVDFTTLGPKLVELQVYDLAGNKGTKSFVVNVVAEQDPVIVMAGTKDATNTYYETAPSATFTDDSVVTATITNNGTGITTAYTAGTEIKEDGNFTINATDALGNIATPVTFDVNLLVKEIDSVTDFSNALVNQQDGQTWNLASGTYDMPKTNILVSGQTGWYLPITANDLTIKGAAGTVVTSSTYSPNGVWADQNFFTIWGDNVTLDGFNIMSKTKTNKVIEVMGKNFTLKNSHIYATSDGYSGVIYFNPANNPGETKDMGNMTIDNVILDKSDVSYRDNAWGSGAMSGNLTFNNVTINNEAYGIPFNWGAIVNGSGVTSVGTVVTTKNLLIKLDNLYDVDYFDEFFAILKPGTTVKLTPGVYNIAKPTPPAGVTLDDTGVTYTP